MESAVDAHIEVESDIVGKTDVEWTVTPLDEENVTQGAASMNDTLMTDSGWSEGMASTSNPTPFKSRQRNMSDPTCSSSFYDRTVMETTQQSVADLRYDSWVDDYWQQAQERLVDARLQDREVSRDMERENMHLYLSEMLIAAIEQMKWKRESEAILAAQKLHSEPNSSRSTSYTVPDSALPDDMSSSDEYHDTSANLETCPIRTGGSVFYTSVSELEASTSKPSTSRREEQKEENDDDEESESEGSAEAIASSLLRHFSSMREDGMANDIQWLVSYADAPQMLLPMPTSTAVCDDEFDAEGKPIRLRGSSDWAPPRKQWIFTLHPSPKGVWRMLEEQNQRCAGCGIKVNRVYARRMRYCDYYGKWFCQRCHQGARMRTPARLIYQWNFREFPVSDIAHRFLLDNYSQPVINALAVDPNLYQRVGRLRRIRNLRIKLFHLWPFIRTCPITLRTMTKCGNLRSMFTSVPRHILSDVDAYSMSDLENARNGDLIRLMDPLVRYGQCHVEGCERCGSQAFVCELCDRSDQLLFPFQTEKVFRCEDCGSLSHLRCAAKHFKQTLPCPKCTRIAINSERHRRHSTNSIAPPEMGRSET